jgi:hypothetical protein
MFLSLNNSPLKSIFQIISRWSGWGGCRVGGAVAGVEQVERVLVGRVGGDCGVGGIERKMALMIKTHRPIPFFPLFNK